MCRSDPCSSTVFFRSSGKVISKSRWGLLHGLPDDFVNRRYAFLHLPKAAAAQRDHSFVNRLAPQFERRGAHENQFAEILGDFHHFVQADTTLVAGVVALLAALALVGNHRL